MHQGAVGLAYFEQAQVQVSKANKICMLGTEVTFFHWRLLLLYYFFIIEIKNILNILILHLWALNKYFAKNKRMTKMKTCEIGGISYI